MGGRLEGVAAVNTSNAAPSPPLLPFPPFVLSSFLPFFLSLLYFAVSNGFVKTTATAGAAADIRILSKKPILRGEPPVAGYRAGTTTTWLLDPPVLTEDAMNNSKNSFYFCGGKEEDNFRLFAGRTARPTERVQYQVKSEIKNRLVMFHPSPPPPLSSQCTTPF